MATGNKIATLFVDIQADTRSLDANLNKKLTNSMNKASKNAKIKPNVNMNGINQQIRTGLPALDRTFILMGAAAGASFSKSFADISKRAAAGTLWHKAVPMVPEIVYRSINKVFVPALAAISSGIGIALVAVGGLTLGLLKLGSATELVTAKLEAMVKVTDGISGKDMIGLDDLAKKLQYISGASEDVIKNAEAVLLSFIDIRGDIFDRAITSAQDLSALLGTDLVNGTLQLGKALSDPSAQLGALTRSGVTFSEEQKKQIKAAQALGNLYKAQSMTLDIIEAQSAGVSKSIGRTLSGSWSYFWNNVKEAAGTIGSITAAIANLAPELRTAGDGIAFMQKGFEKFLSDLEVANDSMNKFQEMMGTTIYQHLKNIWDTVKPSKDRLTNEENVTKEIAKQVKLLTGAGFDSISKLAQQFAIDQQGIRNNKTDDIAKSESGRIFSSIKDVGKSIFVASKLGAFQNPLKTAIDVGIKEWEVAKSIYDSIFKKSDDDLSSLTNTPTQVKTDAGVNPIVEAINRQTMVIQNQSIYV